MYVARYMFAAANQRAADATSTCCAGQYDAYHQQSNEITLGVNCTISSVTKCRVFSAHNYLFGSCI